MTKNYAKEAKNARAVVQMHSWLTASGIEHRLSKTVGADLTVKTGDGREVEVKLALDATEARPQDALVVMAKDFTSKHQDVALKAFHGLTEALGHGQPMPMDRGPAPTHKLHFSDNPELVALRHNEFRRVPNPDPKDLEQFKPVMTQACYSFLNRNQEACRRHSLNIDDLMSYAMMWTTIYLGLYRVLRETNNDNVKKLRRFLNQRFVEFFGTWKRKERNILPSPDTVHIAMLGKPLDANHRLESFSYDPTEDDSVDPDWRAKHAEIDTSSDEARARSAERLLTQKLAELPHDKLLVTLEEASANVHLCMTARHEAARRLRDHRKTCVLCGGKPQEPNKTAKESTMDQGSNPTPETTPAPDNKPEKTPRASNADLFPNERTIFIASLGKERECPKCKAKKPVEEFGIRLMNGKDAAESNGTIKPVFRVQAQCRTCRSTKAKSGAAV